MTITAPVHTDSATATPGGTSGAPEHEAQVGPALVAEDLVAEDLVAEDLLVEDVSIDGMCGVY
jgi:mycofactocin precursor